ncbi:MAG: sugar ABC transporter ATP-binding protein [Azospirillaceae bacterium]|nr:sugar ABC transporter ATP-binding protein [Azospirillaceae bacterium]
MNTLAVDGGTRPDAPAPGTVMMGPLGEVVLKAEAITKVYPGTTALKEVSFNVYKGKVNVLVGENGAGKSTLMKIIAGVEHPTSGRILLDGKAVVLSDTLAAAANGIGIVFQELNLFPNLNVAENIHVARELTRHHVAIRHREQEQAARVLMQRLEQDIDPRALVGDLRIGQQQIVEIAKSLSRNARVLIMDEPTSALSATEVEVLFRIIAELKAKDVSIVYISHRLEELTRIGDMITVLRDGRLVGERRIADIDIPWIINSMVGARGKSFAAPAAHAPGPVVFQAEDITRAREGGGFLVDHVNLQVRAGEIVGIYGLMGAGRSEFFDCLMGRLAGCQGVVRINGKPAAIARIDERIRAGLALVPEDRQRDGLVPILSVTRNMTLASLWKYLKYGVHICRDREIQAVRDRVNQLRIKVANIDNEVNSLSGGNQQKVVIGRALLTDPKVLLLDEPTRGIDIGAKGEVFQTMRNLADAGLAVIFATSDLDEIMAMSDRMIVMSLGRITGEFARGSVTREVLVSASAIGHGTSGKQPVTRGGGTAKENGGW